MTDNRNILVLKHIDGDSLARFGEFFTADGFAPHIVNLHRGEAIPDLSGYDMMFVMGGAMQVWEEDQYPWLKTEKQAIREWVLERRKPYLGICLGHQLLATALGGEAGMARESEVGHREIVLNEAGLAHPLLAGLEPRQPVMQWHYAEVTRVPAEAVSLASSASCEHQILAVGDHALSVQYHCEWTTEFIRTWANLPSWIKALEDEHGEGALDRIIEVSTPSMPRIHRAISTVYGNLKTLNGMIQTVKNA